MITVATDSDGFGMMKEPLITTQINNPVTSPVPSFSNKILNTSKDTIIKERYDLSDHTHKDDNIA